MLWIFDTANTMRYSDICNWNLDLDLWLNRYIPRNHLNRLPSPISRFLGHGQRRPIGNVLVAWWAFIGAFVGVISIEAALMIPGIRSHGAPIVIASFVRDLAAPSVSATNE